MVDCREVPGHNRIRIPLLGATLAALTTYPEMGRAQQATSKVQYSLSYRAAEGCPDETSFRERLQRRTSRAQAADEGADVRFRVEVEPRDDGEFRGTLTVTAGGAPRAVSDPSCEAVVDALTLIAALTIDPEADTSPVPSPNDSPPEPNTKEPSRRRSRPQPAASKPKPIPAPKAAAAPRTSEVVSSSHRRWTWTLSAGPTLQGEVAPTLAWGGHGRAEVEGTSTSPITPALGLELRAARSTSGVGEGRQVRFTWLIAALRSCAVQLSLTRHLDAGVCPLLQAGTLTGEALEVPRGRSASEPWLAPGAEVRVRVLPEPFIGEVAAGAVYPLNRRRFFLEPNETVKGKPGWATSLTLSMGVKIE